MIKQLIKRPLRAMGYDVVRLSPAVSDSRIVYPSTGWLDRFDVRTILDIGANEGDFAQTMSERFPAATIYSFEPLNEAFTTLKAKISRISRCKAFNFALGDVNAESEIHQSEYSPSSSILPMADLHRQAFPTTAKEIAKERIQIRRLDDMTRDLDLRDDLFIKIDVQGFEASVIRGARETLSRAKVAIVETSFQTLYEGQALFDEVYQLLKELGFSYQGNWEQLKDPRNDRVLQADGIYLRNDSPSETT